MLETDDEPAKIVGDWGLKQTSDTGAMDARIDGILAANRDKVLQYKAGKQALFGSFVGQAMKAMAGEAPGLTRGPPVVGDGGRKAVSGRAGYKERVDA